MAGESKTTQFMLGAATVMVGAPAEVLDLNPTDHSIGLVKNFSLTSEPQYIELTQGIQNTVVASVMNANTVRAAMEVYEYTAKNITYGLGLDGTSVSTPNVETTLGSAVTAADSDITVAGGDGTNFSVGDYVLLVAGDADHVYSRRITAIATDTLTLSRAIPVNVSAGAKVIKVNKIDVGAKDDQPYLGAKVVGSLASGQTLEIIMPKIRVIRGFNLGFSTDDFGNMPFEFTVYDLVASDSMFSEFNGANTRVTTL